MFAAPSALHVANLTNLVWLRAECLANAAGAAGAAERFAIGVDEARFYAEMPDGAVAALCCELDLSLFVPRFDSQTLSAALHPAMSSQPLGPPSELELRNLANLQALRDACQAGDGDAIWIYRIDRATAAAYRNLDHADVVALSRALTVSAFLPRYTPAEVANILDKPAGTRALFATAFETEIAGADDAARRLAYLTN